MRLIKPSVEFLDMTKNPLQVIERAGRTCYKSEDRITPGSAEVFVRKLLSRGHLAMIEHAWMSYRVVCDRGVTHEIVRHRLFSYAQESTRYCDYSGGVTFVIPSWLDLPEGEYEDMNSFKDVLNYEAAESDWVFCLMRCASTYGELRQHNWSPQQARGVLPNALKTEIVMTGNLREWRHFFELRCSPKAHPQMREVADLLLTDARERVDVIFEDIDKK